jgi:hypothetical protein
VLASPLLYFGLLAVLSFVNRELRSIYLFSSLIRLDPGLTFRALT